MQKSMSLGYVLEVIGHLLWAYAVIIVVWGVFFSLSMLVISGGRVDKTLEIIIAFASAPAFFVSLVHIFVFGAFRYYFLPRFPDAPLRKTFGIAAVGGTVFLTIVWCLEAFKALSNENSLEGFPAWVSAHALEIGVYAAAAAGLTLGAAGLGWVLEQMGGQQRLMYGVGRWLGWLIAGRERYEAFLAAEAARLHKAYEDYVAEIRSEKKDG